MGCVMPESVTIDEIEDEIEGYGKYFSYPADLVVFTNDFVGDKYYYFQNWPLLNAKENLFIGQIYINLSTNALAWFINTILGCYEEAVFAIRRSKDDRRYAHAYIDESRVDIVKAM